jgi:hypothetical protein
VRRDEQYLKEKKNGNYPSSNNLIVTAENKAARYHIEPTTGTVEKYNGFMVDTRHTRLQSNSLIPREKSNKFTFNRTPIIYS